MENFFSIWLVPQDDDKLYLEKVIFKLANENYSPAFTPHLTICGDITITLEKLKSAFDNAFNQAKPFKIKKTGVGQSEDFFKTVYIEFEINQELRDLFLKLSEGTDKRLIENFKPHMSLIYKKMPKDEKLAIIDKLYLKNEYTIGAAYLTAPKKGKRDWYDVKDWRILYKKRF